MNINNIGKFSYLKLFLCPSPYESHLEDVELLKQRDGKPQLLISTYMEEQLVKLDKIEKSNDVSKM